MRAALRASSDPKALANSATCQRISRSVFASVGPVSKPSVNQSKIGARRSRAAARFPCCATVDSGSAARALWLGLLPAGDLEGLLETGFPGGPRGSRVGAATLPGAETSRPPTTTSRLFAQRHSLGQDLEPGLGLPPRHTPRPARRANGGAATLVPRRERPTPDGDAPPTAAASPCMARAHPRRCAPARRGAANFARRPGPSRRRHAPGLPRRLGALADVGTKHSA